MKMEEIDEGTPSVFSSLPEGCISNIIALTSPKDACRESAVSWLFKSASESDTVWERFLPCDYRETVSRSVDSPPLKYATKKELFFSLCHTPVIINGGKLSFWLSKSSGKKCYMLCARELSIVLKNAPVHWSWRSVPESRFSEVAELVAVRWLEIRGRMQTQILSLKTTYAAYLVFSVTSDHYGLEEVARTFVGFSEDIDSAYNFAATVGHMSCLDVLEPESKPVYLLPEEAISPPAWQPRIPHPTSRTDGWMEILLGEFFNDEGEETLKDAEIPMLSSEIKTPSVESEPTASVSSASTHHRFCRDTNYLCHRTRSISSKQRQEIKKIDASDLEHGSPMLYME